MGKRTVWLAVALAAAALEAAAQVQGTEAGPKAAPGRAAHTLKNLTPGERLAYLRRAQAWHRVDIPSMDVRRGPQIPGAVTVMQDVTCRFKDDKMGGTTPKFTCVIPPKDSAKVRYLPWNGKVYAAVAGTRLFWALGFATDAEYPVRVTCLDCPKDPWSSKQPRFPQVVFDRAVIERHPDVEVAVAGQESQWGWNELTLVDEAQGGASRAELDALRLLAVFVQHGDNKAINQHLGCAPDDVRRDASGSETCEKPLLVVQDLGNTFGHGSFLHARTVGSANYHEWSRVEVWKDPATCRGELDSNITHPTLSNPVISEAGRRFLADLLVQLTDDQIRGLFEVSDLPNREWKDPEDRDHNGTLDQWVAAFHSRRDQIVNHVCPQ
ncbi:MAG TPA: hypothetical protein VGL15_11560 [Vicinamibacteria bacterium]